MATVEGICREFGIRGDLLSEQQMRAGNINTTYSVIFRDEDGHAAEYVVQKINGYVFRNPTQIMSNVALVTEHMDEKILADGGDPCRMVLHFLKKESGENFTKDEEGNVWRVYQFIPNSVCFDATEDLQVLQRAGEAFGRFQKNLMDFDATKLYETIEDFHNTPKRLDRLFDDIAADPCGRVSECEELILYIAEKRAEAEEVVREVEDGVIPLRVTHNDTKCNNVLFDKQTHAALAVIDLDTIMPGLMAYDFGDAIRFAANTAAEDEPDLTKISLDLEKFRAFTKGFVGVLGSECSEAELESLAKGCFGITIELASRFLDDYLTGDKYFTTRYPGHNLVRAAAQVALAKDMEKKLPQMQQIVREAAKHV